MKTINVVPFIEFIKSQPDDRFVEHTGGWHSCAVADYCRKTDMKIILEDHEPTCIDGMKDYRMSDEHLKILELDSEYDTDEDKSYWNLLSNAMGFEELLKNVNIDINTYGGLKEVLKEAYYCPREVAA